MVASSVHWYRPQFASRGEVTPCTPYISLELIINWFRLGDNLFNDNRSCVVHVLDSLYRAESHLPRFTQVIENCVLELATRNVILTTQDISAVLRVFQRYRDTNSINFCLALQKVATAMNERITNGKKMKN